MDGSRGAHSPISSTYEYRARPSPLVSRRDDAQTDGGYIGFDVASFISAVVSAAAGFYSLGLADGRNINVDLVFQPSQIVRISAASAGTALGSGALTVSRDSEVTLSHLTVSAPIVVKAGAILTLEDVLVSASITVQAGALLTLEEVRFGAAGYVVIEDETSQVVRLGSQPEPPRCADALHANILNPYATCAAPQTQPKPPFEWRAPIFSLARSS